MSIRKDDMETYFTPEQVAQRFGVNRQTIYSMISRQQLDAYTFGRSRRITERQIQECLDRRYQRPIIVLGPNA